MEGAGVERSGVVGRQPCRRACTSLDVMVVNRNLGRLGEVDGRVGAGKEAPPLLLAATGAALATGEWMPSETDEGVWAETGALADDDEKPEDAVVTQASGG